METKVDQETTTEYGKTDTNVSEYREAAKILTETEIKEIMDEDLRNAAQELLEEQQKAIAQMVQEHKLAIKEAIEEEKKAIWTRIEELRRSILKLGIS